MVKANADTCTQASSIVCIKLGRGEAGYLSVLLFDMTGL